MDELQVADSQLSDLTVVNGLSNNDDLNVNSSRKYLTFKIDDKDYGADIDKIKEIIEYNAMTRVPLTPPHIRGVSNLRGNVIPIVDLAVRLNKPSRDITKRTCIIIVELDDDGESMDIGFVVDEVDEVMDINHSQIEAAPQFGADIRGDFIFGMVQIESHFVVLLSIDEVLSITELSELILNEQSQS